MPLAIKAPFIAYVFKQRVLLLHSSEKIISIKNYERGKEERENHKVTVVTGGGESKPSTLVSLKLSSLRI